MRLVFNYELLTKCYFDYSGNFLLIQPTNKMYTKISLVLIHYILTDSLD